MKIVGCDLHARQQAIAMLTPKPGEPSTGSTPGSSRIPTMSICAITVDSIHCAILTLLAALRPRVQT